MAIQQVWTNSVAMLTASTSVSIDITGATVGDWVYAWLTFYNSQTSTTLAGWTKLIEGDDSTYDHYALYRRKKQAGDTTFTVSWPSSSKAVIGLASYRGLDSTTPDEGASALLHAASSVSYVTGTSTPSGTDRWALACFLSRTSTSGNLPETFSPPTGFSPRLTATNDAAAGAPWIGLLMADSNAPVTEAAHSYTATLSSAESHGVGMLIFLIPARDIPPHAPPGIPGDGASTSATNAVTEAVVAQESIRALVQGTGGSAQVAQESVRALVKGSGGSAQVAQMSVRVLASTASTIVPFSAWGVPL